MFPAANVARGILRQRDLLFSHVAAISIFPFGVLYSAKQKRIPDILGDPKDYAKPPSGRAKSGEITKAPREIN